MLTKSFDGVSIAYDMCGIGPALVLLHGFGNDRSMWRSSGWVDRLRQEFTVVTLDFRGCGASDRPIDPNAYTAEAHCKDIDAVLAMVGIDNPSVWGWSLGATVALHYAKRGRARLTIAAGTYFGPMFTTSYIEKQLTMTDDPVTKARLKGLLEWPILLPRDIVRPFLVYTGTADGNVYRQVLKQKGEVIAAGGIVQIVDGANHDQLAGATTAVHVLVTSFIRERLKK
jgi:pimeloyl-ACP methyl ester carboxylesterase